MAQWLAFAEVRLITCDSLLRSLSLCLTGPAGDEPQRESYHLHMDGRRSQLVARATGTAGRSCVVEPTTNTRYSLSYVAGKGQLRCGRLHVGIDWLWLEGWSDFVKLCSPTRPFCSISPAPGEGHAAEHSTMLVMVVKTIGQTREKEMRGQIRQGGRRIYSRPSTRWAGALTGVREVFRDQTFLVLPSSLSSHPSQQRPVSLAILSTTSPTLTLVPVISSPSP